MIEKRDYEITNGRHSSTTYLCHLYARQGRVERRFSLSNDDVRDASSPPSASRRTPGAPETLAAVNEHGGGLSQGCFGGLPKKGVSSLERTFKNRVSVVGLLKKRDCATGFDLKRGLRHCAYGEKSGCVTGLKRVCTSLDFTFTFEYYTSPPQELGMICCQVVSVSLFLFFFFFFFF